MSPQTKDTAERPYYLEERHEAIQSLVAQRGVVRVSELSRHFGVTSATIRKDLQSLEEQGLLRRTHGGAIAPHSESVEQRFEAAEASSHAEKVRIGHAGAAYVEDDDVLFVQSGTTCLELVRALGDRRGLTIITSDLAIAIEAERILEDATVIVFGGTLRSGFHYTQGPDALRQLEGYYAPKAFLCANAFSFERGITAHRREQAEWVQRLIASSGTHIMLLDSSKIGISAPARVAGLESLDVFITDSGASEQARRRFAAEAPELEVVYA